MDILGFVLGLLLFLLYMRWEDRRAKYKALKQFREFKRVLDATYWSDNPPEWLPKSFYTMDNITIDPNGRVLLLNDATGEFDMVLTRDVGTAKDSWK